MMVGARRSFGGSSLLAETVYSTEDRTDGDRANVVFKGMEGRCLTSGGLLRPLPN